MKKKHYSIVWLLMTGGSFGLHPRGVTRDNRCAAAGKFSDLACDWTRADIP